MEGGHYFWLGASADAETGSREPSPSVSALTGFDPARICPHCEHGRIGMARCLACHGTGFVCNACDPQ